MATSEPELEQLLVDLVPQLPHEWQGATSAEIHQLEKLARRPLPPFYRWFLERMGRSMGTLRYPTMNFSAARVLSCYREELIEPDGRLLLIGYETNEVSPLHMFYDLDRAVRDDARVVLRHENGGDLHSQAETFRELFAWGKLLRFRVNRMPHRCEGCFVDESNSFADSIGEVMTRLGFVQRVRTGPLCGLYERADATLVWQDSPEDPQEEFHCFDLGGTQESVLRQVLGVIAIQTSIEVEVDSWTSAKPSSPRP